jgi:hypothetical protein
MTQPEVSRTTQDQHIFDMVGIWPIAPPVPNNQVAGWVEGVLAGDTVAMESLIGYRLAWVYESFATREAIQARTDLDEQDIMQIGCLATLEAAHRTILNSPTPVRQQIVNLQEREAERLVTRSKLIPSVDRYRDQHLTKRRPIPIYDGFHIPFDERAIDPVTVLKGASLNELVEADARPQSIENSIFKSAAFQRGLLKTTLERLTAEELIIIRGRFGYDSEWPKSLGEIAKERNTSRGEIRKKEHGALEKMREIIPAGSTAVFQETTDDDFTNYGVA